MLIFGYNPNLATTYSLADVAPTGGTINTLISGISVYVGPISLNPAVSGQFVFANLDLTSGHYGIYSNASLTTTGATALVPPTYTGIISLSITQDGKNIVYTASLPDESESLFTLPVAGGVPTVLDSVSVGSCVSTANPDTIFYCKPATGTAIVDQVFSRSLKAGANGTATQITSNSGIDARVPAVSRDGTQVAYEGTDISGGTGNENFYVENLSSKVTTILPNPTQLNLGGVAFNSDGTSLAFTATDSSSNGYLETQAISATASSTPIFPGSSSIMTQAGVYWTSGSGRGVGLSGMQNLSVRRNSRHR